MYYTLDNDTSTCMLVNASSFRGTPAAVFPYKPVGQMPTNITGVTMRMKGPKLPCHVDLKCNPDTVRVMTDMGDGSGTTFYGKCQPFCGRPAACRERAIPTPTGTDCEYQCDCFENKCNPTLLLIYNKTFSFTSHLKICEVDVSYN